MLKIYLNWLLAALRAHQETRGCLNSVVKIAQRKARRRVAQPFLLLEVVASLGLITFFMAGVLSPYAKARQNLEQFQAELKANRVASIMTMHFHADPQILQVLPSWEASAKQELKGKINTFTQNIDGRQEKLSFKILFMNQKPLKADRKNGLYPWKRLLALSWYQPNGKECFKSYFTVVSGPSRAQKEQSLMRSKNFTVPSLRAKG